MIRPGQRIENYRVMGKLANGGMASVYLARDLRHNERLVVLKVILPHLRNNSDYRAMFEREAAVGALVRHPNSVDVHGIFVWQGQAVLVMEFLDGRNLIQVIGAARRRKQAISFSVVAHVVSRVARALELAWNIPGPNGESAQIIHRDISPENVVLTYDGEVKLVDFGIAKHNHIEGNTQAGQLKGKYSYMSPEQIRGEAADHRADQYSQCVLLYILLTGRKPFVAANDVELLRLIVGEDPVPPSQIDPTIPGVLEEIALRGLRKAPAARFSDHGHLAAHLEDRFLAQHPASYADIRTLMSELFPEQTDAVRRRIQMLVDAERDATVTGVFIELPEPEADLTVHDETIIEIPAPEKPVANFRATAIVPNPLPTEEETSIGEATILVDLAPPPTASTSAGPNRQLPPRAQTTRKQQVLPKAKPQGRKPQRATMLALFGLALTALFAGLLAQVDSTSPIDEKIGVETQQGTVALRSTGADEAAEVRINGALVGSTPVEIKHRAGNLRVICSFPRRKVVLRQQIDLRAGTRKHVLCSPGHADLHITGPRGYSISIDGKDPVAIPVSLVRTMEGEYELIWSRPGRRKTSRRTLRLAPDEKRSIHHWKALK
jgi:serine/threonine-protein kinase